MYKAVWAALNLCSRNDLNPELPPTGLAVPRLLFCKIANLLRVPFMTGFTYWNDLIRQTHENLNINMLDFSYQPHSDLPKIIPAARQSSTHKVK